MLLVTNNRTSIYKYIFPNTAETLKFDKLANVWVSVS